jgi:hypothetical protein
LADTGLVAAIEDLLHTIISLQASSENRLESAVDDEAGLGICPLVGKGILVEFVRIPRKFADQNHQCHRVVFLLLLLLIIIISIISIIVIIMIMIMIMFMMK